MSNKVTIVPNVTDAYAMMVLTEAAAVQAAKRWGLNEEGVARLKRWKRLGMTDEDRRVYHEYRTRFECGRGFIEIALAHGINPGTLRRRYYRRKMTINQALIAGRGIERDLVEVHRRDDGLRRGKVV
jgi:hypothetical protein